MGDFNIVVGEGKSNEIVDKHELGTRDKSVFLHKTIF